MHITQPELSLKMLSVILHGMKDVCEKTGFKGISQVWKEDPAWYFWLNQVKGAFLLRLPC